MDYKTLAGGAAVISGIAQYLPYIRDILRRKTHPHAFSWFIWGLPCGIIFIAQLSRGAGAGTWATGITTILCTVIFILSLFYGEKEITRLDWAGLLLALASIVLWIITRDPLDAVILITFADILGFVPTLRKSVDKPHEETLSSYMAGSVKWLLSLAALGSYSLTTCLYPVAMLVANTLFAGMLAHRRKRL